MMIVGLSGVARSGKDTFCQLLIEELAKRDIVAKRFALADQLKEDLRQFLIEKLGIDVLACLPEEKELIRPLLVDYGKIRRILSQGKYWTSLVKEAIFKTSGVHVPIITDVRYDVYPDDEVPWIKDEMHGTLVHISRYTGLQEETVFQSDIGGANLIHKCKSFVLPPNEDEALNDPRVKAKADYKVEWATGDIEGICRPEVIKFVNWFPF